MTEQVSQKQKRLAALMRSAAGPFRIADAASVLGLEQQHAAKLLAAWHKQGSIRRIARGVYVPVSPASLGQDQVLEDPWILIPELYEPAYAGGWSALEHWDLTEQLFRSVCVLTTKRTQSRDVRHQGVAFHVKQVAETRMFGTKPVWRGARKILVSDQHKTILDVIDDPRLGAGLQHTMDAMSEYGKRYARSDSIELLLDYADRMRVGSIFKKLGYLGERLRFPEDFVSACAKKLTFGYTHLDKTASKEKLVTKWRLWVPEGVIA